MKVIKLFLLLIVLVFGAVLAFVVTFDANNYKPEIIAQVEKATGRDFAIDGEINLSVFPWVGLKVDDVALGNEKGFKGKQFAAIRQLDIKVNLLPLIKKEVQVNTIRLHGLDVSLEVAADGSNNWSGIAQEKTAGDADKTTGAAEAVKAGEDTKSPESKTSSADKPSESGEKDEAFALQSLQVEGIEFIAATIRYDDRSTGARATVSDLNLTTSNITFDQAVDVEFGARVENNQPAIDTRLKLITQLTFNKDFTVINFKDFVLKILAKANAFLPQEEEIKITSTIDVLMNEQRITLKKIQLSALGTTTLADIVVSQFLEMPLIQGSIKTQPFNAREVAGRAGVVLPAMAKADALHQVALSSKLKLQGEKLQADELEIKLDDSTVSGWLHVLNLTKQQLRYELSVDALKLNDYLPPVAAVTAGSGKTDTGGQGQPAAMRNQTAAVAAPTGDEKIELPIEMMRQLDAQGDLRIAALTAMEYDITQLLMTLKAKNGDIAVKPLSLKVLDGQVNSSVNMNVQKEKPVYAINVDVNQVQVGPVANPFLDHVMGDKPITMEGAVNVIADIKATGETVNQLKKASKGQVVIDMNETRVDGFDPEYYMRSSIAQYVDSKGFGLSETITGSFKPREVTVFDKIHSTVNLADGKARTNDFLMDSRRVQVRAEGFADIIENRLDVTSSVQLPRSKTAVEKIFDEPVYVRVHGPFAALEYELDRDRLKQSTTDVLQDEAKAKAKEKVEAEKQRLKEKAEAERLRAEEKAKEELKKNTEKFEDKLKDKLKGLF